MAGVELATGWINLVPSASGIATKLAEELGAPLEDAARASGDKASSSWGAAFGVGVAAAAAVALVGLEKIGSAFDDAGDKIRVTTGATGPVLDSLQASFDNVVRNVPADMDDASTAIATLNQKLELTGRPLEDLSTQVLNLSRITGTDLAGNVKATADVFNSWGVSVGEQGPKLDELFRVSQQTGISVSELATAMATGGVRFRAAGLDFEASASLLGLLAKSGLDAGAVMPALSRVMATAAKDGRPAADVFRETFAAIRNAPSETAGAAAAIDVFGAKAGPQFAALIREGKLSYEEMAAAIAGGGDTVNAAAAATDDWREKLQVLMNRGMVALAPIATQVFDAVGKAIAVVAPVLIVLGQAFSSVLSWLSDHKDVLIAAVVGIGAALVPMFVSWAVSAGAAAVATIVAAAPFIAIGVAVAALALGVVWLVENFDIFTTAAGAVRDAFVAMWNFLTDNIGPVLQTLVDVWLLPARLAFEGIKAVLTDVLIPAFQQVWGFITGTVIPVFQAVADKVLFVSDTVSSVAGWIADRVGDIVNAVTGIPGRIAAVASTMFDGIRTAITTAKDWVSDRVGDVVGFFTRIPGRIRDGFVVLGDAIIGPFKAAFNAIARMWNSTIGALRFEIPSWIPFVGGRGWDVPDIPEWHHAGGVVRGVPGADVPTVLSAGELVLTSSQQAQLFAMANGSATRDELPPITLNNYRQDIGVAELNQVLAMARLR